MRLGPAGIDLYANCMFVTMSLPRFTAFLSPPPTRWLAGVGCVAMDPKGVNWASVGRIGKL